MLSADNKTDETALSDRLTNYYRIKLISSPAPLPEAIRLFRGKSPRNGNSFPKLLSESYESKFRVLQTAGAA